MEKVLVVVAHPDDETVWMGGSLIKNCVIEKNWKVEIISLCRKNDTERTEKFFKVCRILNAQGFISDLDDSEEEDYKEITPEDITRRVKKFINGNYDIIFTHGENGEYSHIRHKQIHNAVKGLLESGELKAKKAFFFSYIERGEFCDINSSADNLINLDKNLYSRKKFIIQGIYGFDKGSFEEKSCRKKEAFELLK
ncbi:MAG: PIG-L family deacetylase [Nanoarchaeota archaeon]